jgi:hypothetical protein
MSPVEILKFAVTIGVIPQPAEIDRKGRATWTAGEFSLAAQLQRRPDERIVWHAFVGDAKLGPSLSKFGSLSVAIDPAVDDSLDQSQANRLTESVDAFLRGGLEPAQQFVADRADLAQILASETDKRRGNLTTWLPRANYPARLVQALIIARDLGAVDLESTIHEKLRSGVLVLAGGREVDIAASAKHWAKQYSKALGFEVPV